MKCVILKKRGFYNKNVEKSGCAERCLKLDAIYPNLTKCIKFFCDPNRMIAACPTKFCRFYALEGTLLTHICPKYHINFAKSFITV